MASGSARVLTIASQSDDLSGLAFQTTEIPQDLGDHEVLVELHAASLNYRDIAIAKVCPANTATLNVRLSDKYIGASGHEVSPRSHSGV